tara:strand:+ start:680 stop:934 length:255 start_codon:yes stop_codon:yes gene_type:complete
MSNSHHSGMSGSAPSLDWVVKAVKAMLKKIDDENKALKEVVHKCEKCSKYMHIDSDEYNDAISDEDGELWWCQTCFDYHQEHGW